MENLWIIENENGTSRRRRARKVVCEECGIVFLDRLNGNRRFCSSKCSGLHSRDRIVCCCAYCKVLFDRPKNKFKYSRSGLHFCCRICKDKAQSIEGGIKEIQPGHYNNGESGYRQRAFKNSDSVSCVDCNESREYLLVVHHIDGDRTNESLKNLEIVCMNCHAKRHLHNVNGKWVYLPSSLTPRELLPSF